MRVLLYAPSLTGHPQVYCRVIGDILLEAGHEVVVAAGLDGADWPARWPDLKPFAAHARVAVVDTREWSAAGLPDLRAEELGRLAGDLRIEATLMPEADRFAVEFRRIAEEGVSRLPGRTVGIFARTSGWHPRENDYGGAPLPPWGGTWRQRAGWACRAVCRRRETDAWFFRTVLQRKRAVERIPVSWARRLHMAWDFARHENRDRRNEPGGF